MTIVTDTFKVTPAAYFKIAAGAVFPKLIVFCALIIIAAIAAGAVFDIRFLLVALIIIFIVVPMIVGHIYFSRLLTAQAQYALMPKRVVIIPDESITEVFESADPENVPPHTRLFRWDSISSRKISGKNLAIVFGNSDYTLIVPLNSFGNDVPLENLTDTDDDSEE